MWIYCLWYMIYSGVWKEVISLCYTSRVAIPLSTHTSQFEISYPIGPYSYHLLCQLFHHWIFTGQEHQAYQESLDKLSMQISFEEIKYAKTSPFLCFTLESGLPVRTFKTLNDFSAPTCLSVYIPGGHEFVISSDTDGIKLLTFETFKTNVDDFFQTNVVVEAQP